MSGLRLLKGALAGCIATGPMTVAMLLMHRLLPRQHRYELPPMIITRRFMGGKGPLARFGTNEHKGLTILTHFGFGAAFGAVYALIPRQGPFPPALRGVLYAMCIWSGSYLGWIPAANILPPASKHPVQRNLLMIVAHVIWGAGLSVLLDRLDPDEASQRAQHPDRTQNQTEPGTVPAPAIGPAAAALEPSPPPDQMAADASSPMAGQILHINGGDVVNR